MAHGPLFSVVIGTFNGADRLAAALDALDQQRLEQPFEVIVVNDASTDETARVATRGSVRLFTLAENSGHGHTLNVGLEHARGQFLALMDDDCVPPPDWLERLAGAWASVPGDVTVIGGPVVPFSVDSFNRRYVAYRRPLRPQEAVLSDRANVRTRLRHAFFPPTVEDRPRAIYYAVGANMSVRVDAARRVGGFTDRRGAGEEESIVRPLRELYGEQTVRYFPDVVMRHEFGRGLRDSLHRARMYGRSHGRDWVRDGGTPMTRPVPVAGALVLLAAVAIGPLVAVAWLVAAPLVLYRRWPAELRRRGSPEVLAYPFVEAIEELADNVGFLEGVATELRHRGGSH